MQVKIADGIVEGETLTHEIGGTFHSFKGIPYAAPPVGDLRFKAPQPVKPWDGVRSAKKHGSICHQFNFLERHPDEGSEDCLYLNVYTPNTKPDKPLPVMVFIHGGAFCFGSGNDDIYGPEFLIRHGVILVTFNYRLELFGFLCLDTEEVPGNAGMKDQVAALRWVNKNIANFGGDPNNVTIFGQSAGACSVTYHCVSPMSKGLFKRGIAQSGCIMNTWSTGFRIKDRALALAKRLGFDSEDDKELYEFFKNQPKESLIHCVVPLTFAEKHRDKYEVLFSVVSEKEFPGVEAFFTGDIVDAVKNNVHEGIELILGYNKDDGSFNLTVTHDINETIVHANTLREYFVPKHFAIDCSAEDILKIGETVKKYYTKGNIITKDNLKFISNYHSGEMYKFGIFQLAKFMAAKNKVYVYKFTFKGERNFFTKIAGVSRFLDDTNVVGHVDEIPYLFPVKSINQPINKTSAAFKTINVMTKLWTNFAKSGNPTPDTSLGANWRQFRAETMPCLEIGQTLTRSTNPEKEDLVFWEQIYKQYLPKFVYQKEEA